MAGFLSAAAVAAWAVSIVVVGPAVLIAWVRRRWFDRWLAIFGIAAGLMLAAFLWELQDSAALVDLRPDGMGEELGAWLLAVVGPVVLIDTIVRGGRRPAREREIALFLGTYALGYLFQQVAMVAATGRPW